MEIRAHKNRIDRLKRSLKFYHSFCVDANGLSGGLCLLWNKKVNIQVFQYSSNVFHTLITCPKLMSFNCSFVYAPPTFQQRRHFWEDLRAHQSDRDFPWACVGDFNETLFQAEKEGLRPQQPARMNHFRDFLNDTGLIDMDLKGNKFTWRSNPRNGFVTRE